MQQEQSRATSSQPFGDDVVAAMRRHMNDDHGDDALLICRTLGGQPAATSATAVDVDAEAMHFSVDVDDARVAVRVPLAGPVIERATSPPSRRGSCPSTRRSSGAPPSGRTTPS